MRSLMVSMAFFSMMKLCGGGTDQAATPPIGAAAAGNLTITAQHGGVMVAADDAWIELVTKDNGEVEAYVVDVQGQPLSHEVAQVTQVQVQGNDGRPHEVALQWDDSARRYAGHAEVRPVATASAELSFVVRGQPRRARAPQLVLVAAPPQPPSVVVQGQAPRSVVVTPPQPRVVVQAPQPPSVVVHAPQPPSVVVHAPQPPSVVVHAPQPPSVVVQAPRPPSVVVQAPRPPSVVVQAPRPPSVVVAPPRPGVVIQAPQPRVDVVVEDGHPGRGRGHAYGRRGREGGGTVVVSPPRPPSVVVTPPRAPSVQVRGGGGGGRVEVRAGGGRGRGHD